MKSSFRMHTTILTVILTAVLFAPQQSVAKPDNKNNDNKKPDTVRVLGDSLVDIGNLLPRTLAPFAIPPVTRYNRGRYTNGLTGVEQFSNRLDISLVPSIYGVNLQDSGINWGIGGSTTAVEALNPGGIPVAGLLGQLAEYEAALEAAGIPDGEVNHNNPVLFILWTAHNNYYIPLYDDDYGTAPDEMTVVEAVGDIVTAVTRLQELGAEKIVVANMPDLGLPPICQGLFLDEEETNACDLLSMLSTKHNMALSIALDALDDENGLSIIQFDVHSIFNEIISDPDEYGFSNVVDAGPASGCLFEVIYNPLNCGLVNFRNSTFFWWDEQHPSKDVHKILGDRLYDLVIDN